MPAALPNAVTLIRRIKALPAPAGCEKCKIFVVTSAACLPRKKPASPANSTTAKMEHPKMQSLSDTITATPLKGGWDEGVFDAELLNQSIFPRDISATETGRAITPPKDAGKPAPLSEGTYRGTKLALTQISKRIEKR
jgi:hypothetical protein